IVMDPRFPNESDLFWVSNYHDGTMCALTAYKHPDNPLNIFIKYRQNMEYLLFRENTKPDDYEEIVKHSLIVNLENNNTLETKLKLATQNLTQKTQELQISQDTINYLNNQLNTLNTEINSYPIKKQSLEISNLEQDLISKKLKAQILEKELGLDNEINLKYNNALQENKTLKARLSQKEKDINNLDINHIKALTSQELEIKSLKEALSKKENDINNLELNYQKALNTKNHLSYKLGAALIKANKNWYKGGYIKFIFEVMRIKKGHKNKTLQNNKP
ncbi:MAG: hypothetical protein IKK93_09720, partial [Campylobacter sp.]|nr:hypothetical protein [Campylobacter sp.]